MKNKMGFTLVELLAVIVLLGIIVVIAVPAITSSSRKVKEKMLATKCNLAEQSLTLWAQDNKRCFLEQNSTCLPMTCIISNNNYTCETSLGQMASFGLIEYDENNKVINPIDKNDISNTRLSVIYNNEKKTIKVNNQNCIQLSGNTVTTTESTTTTTTTQPVDTVAPIMSVSTPNPKTYESSKIATITVSDPQSGPTTSGFAKGTTFRIYYGAARTDCETYKKYVDLTATTATTTVSANITIPNSNTTSFSTQSLVICNKDDIKDIAGNTLPAGSISSGDFYFDNRAPSLILKKTTLNGNPAILFKLYDTSSGSGFYKGSIKLYYAYTIPGSDIFFCDYDENNTVTLTNSYSDGYSTMSTKVLVSDINSSIELLTVCVDSTHKITDRQGNAIHENNIPTLTVSS